MSIQDFDFATFLYNKNQNSVETRAYLTSPASLQAVEEAGYSQEDLLRRPIEFFNGNVQVARSYEIQRRAKLDFARQTRKHILRGGGKLRTGGPRIPRTGRPPEWEQTTSSSGFRSKKTTSSSGFRSKKGMAIKIKKPKPVRREPARKRVIARDAPRPRDPEEVAKNRIYRMVVHKLQVQTAEIQRKQKIMQRSYHDNERVNRRKQPKPPGLMRERHGGGRKNLVEEKKNAAHQALMDQWDEREKFRAKSYRKEQKEKKKQLAKQAQAREERQKKAKQQRKLLNVAMKERRAKQFQAHSKNGNKSARITRAQLQEEKRQKTLQRKARLKEQQQRRKKLLHEQEAWRDGIRKNQISKQKRLDKFSVDLRAQPDFSVSRRAGLPDTRSQTQARAADNLVRREAFLQERKKALTDDVKRREKAAAKRLRNKERARAKKQEKINRAKAKQIADKKSLLRLDYERKQKAYANDLKMKVDRVQRIKEEKKQNFLKIESSRAFYNQQKDTAQQLLIKLERAKDDSEIKKLKHILKDCETSSQVRRESQQTGRRLHAVKTRATWAKRPSSARPASAHSRNIRDPLEREAVTDAWQQTYWSSQRKRAGNSLRDGTSSKQPAATPDPSEGDEYSTAIIVEEELVT